MLGGGGDPADQAEMADSLTYAFLVLLDELTPVERAVLLLHDVFRYPFDEVAAAVDRTPDAVRQIASRSRRKVAASPGPLPRARQDQVVETLGGLLGAIASGDVEGVMSRLAPDVVELSDGGADRRASRRPVVGADRVARFLVNLSKRNTHLVDAVRRGQRPTGAAVQRRRRAVHGHDRRDRRRGPSGPAVQPAQPSEADPPQARHDQPTDSPHPTPAPPHHAPPRSAWGSCPGRRVRPAGSAGGRARRWSGRPWIGRHSACPPPDRDQAAIRTTTAARSTSRSRPPAPTGQWPSTSSHGSSGTAWWKAT